MAKTALRRAIDNSKKARRTRRFTHYVPPTRPPANTYDPGLDAAQAAATRGLGDLQSDTQQGLERGSDDYLLASGERAYNSNNALADIARGQQRSVADAGAATAERARQYGLQGEHQREAANAAGLLGASGWDERAAGIRGANQARDQSAADLALARGNEDTDTSLARTYHAGGVAQGQLDLGYSRQTQDAQTALGRAVRENTIFGTDTAQARLYQAQASGLWNPPVKPGNEHRINGNGQYFRRVKGGIVLENGRALTVAQWKALRRRQAAAHG